jgi:hypothetical protein
LFKVFSKLLVCGGNRPDIATCEVINLQSSATTCKNLPNFPSTFHAAIGGLGFKENPIICGGEQSDRVSNKCYSLENSEWVSSVSMKSARAKAAVAQLQDGKLLVTGGSDINSAELLTEEGWQSNIPSLPVTIFVHCMVTVNSTSVMVIGGFQNGLTSAKTFYFTFGKESWTEGPQLKHKRRDTICGRIKQDKESQKMSIIVAGGNDENLLSSVEILDEGSNVWRAGPELPFGIRYSQMVEDQNGAAVLIGGSSSAVEKLDTLYQLPHGGLDAAWTKMAQKLKTGRYWHSAFLVPDTSVDCS